MLWTLKPLIHEDSQIGFYFLLVYVLNTHILYLGLTNKRKKKRGGWYNTGMFQIFFKKGKERENKQLKVASGVFSARGIEPLKAQKRSIKEGSGKKKKKKKGALAPLTTSSLSPPTHPLFTLLSHHGVKRAVRSVSCLRTAGEMSDFCGRRGALTTSRTIKERRNNLA